ncbi:MAG: glycosyltransferase family 2 protein [Bacteroidetes bacterium]|nr:glycosyltransferase family 2 protein [Bacteroidota bacterium]MCL2302555.1 glycosyltransferase family 2 protein [Lentimicrobiaceae bacterium]
MKKIKHADLNPANIFVSVICPIYNEEKYIAACIESILEQDFPKEKLEFLLIDGMSTDKTREIVKHYTTTHSFIRLIDNPDKVAPVALNIGIRNATGSIIIRIDGHSAFPKNYISVLVKYLIDLDADNVGGLWNTLPAKNTLVCNAIAIASGNKFGVGNSLHKVGCKEVIQTDTVPFGCFRREVFDQIGFFDEYLLRAEDDEFNARLINAGGKIFLIPNVVINYYARDTFNKMCKMYYQYGLYKPLVMKKLGRPATLRQFFPMLFVLYLFFGLALSFLSKTTMFLYLSIFLLYWILGLTMGVKEAKLNKKAGLIYLLPLTFFMIHLSYGWGYIVGIFKIFTKTKFSASVTR